MTSPERLRSIVNMLKKAWPPSFAAVHELLTRHVGLCGEDLPLPVVLPMLLHHSETGWTAATSFHELFDRESLR